MLTVYDDLNEVVDLLLQHFDTFLPTINGEKYVFAIAGNHLSGYMKKQWIRRSPIIVYPVYYKGIYAQDFYLTKKEKSAQASEIIEAYREV